jgi:hypothetical protein
MNPLGVQQTTTSDEARAVLVLIEQILDAAGWPYTAGLSTLVDRFIAISESEQQ